MIETLRLIAARSSSALHEALGAIKAQQVRSPLAARRAERAAMLALEDPDTQWTAEERAVLAALLGRTSEGTRTMELRLRVNASEKADVQQAADDAGLSVSNYIRRALGLPELD